MRGRTLYSLHYSHSEIGKNWPILHLGLLWWGQIIEYFKQFQANFNEYSFLWRLPVISFEEKKKDDNLNL